MTWVKAHEHFCSRCYGHKTNGVTSGWWRCTDKKCVMEEKSSCKQHRTQEQQNKEHMK